MRLTLLVGATLLALNFPALAQTCENTYDDVARQFAEIGSPVSEIPADKFAAFKENLRAAGQDVEGVTRAFVATSGGALLLGLEKDGCLLPPIVIGPAPAAPVAPGPTKSGVTPTGTYA